MYSIQVINKCLLKTIVKPQESCGHAISDYLEVVGNLKAEKYKLNDEKFNLLNILSRKYSKKE